MQEEFKLNTTFKYKFRPRFSDIDRYGIAHHSRYFYWFEEARFYWLNKALKLSIEEQLELYAPISNLSAEYKKPIVFEQDYIILCHVTVGDFKPTIKFDYKIMDISEDTLFSLGYTEHVFTNSKGELLFEIPEYLIEYFKSLIIKESRD